MSTATQAIKEPYEIYIYTCKHAYMLYLDIILS